MLNMVSSFVLERSNPSTHEMSTPRSSRAPQPRWTAIVSIL